jgi:predicted MPP superfamily phosphohydrolase
MINPLKSIEINTYRLWHPRVRADQTGFKIAQISDVHLGRWVKPRHMQQVVQFVNAQNPHLVALTGDYVGYDHRDLVPSIETLGDLKGPTFAVLGNHDHWTSTDTALKGFADVNIPVLSNRAVLLSETHSPIEIVGVDDHMTNNSDIEAAFSSVEGDSFCLALNHVPSIAPSLATRGADLILSGHTHGYQFNIPHITNRIAQRLGAEYHVGAYYLDGSYLYINRGLGSASWPWRIGAAPELTFFELARGPNPRLELLQTRDFGVKHRL